MVRRVGPYQDGLEDSLHASTDGSDIHTNYQIYTYVYIKC